MAPTARWAEAAPAAWAELCREDLNASPAHLPALARGIADTLPGHRAEYLLIEEVEALIGGAAVMLERRLGLEWMHAMPFTLPGAPLARAGRHDEVDRLVAAALDARARDLSLVGGEWVLYRPLGPDVSGFDRLPGETLVATTTVVDLQGGMEAALRRVDRRTRESLVHGSQRGLHCAEEPEALDETYALYRSQSRHWPGHRLMPYALLRQLLLGNPAGRLFTVRDTRGMLSGALTLVGAHEWMVWWSGSHPDARMRHAFASLLWHIGTRAAEAGAQRFNLGGSAGIETLASFKRALGAREVRVPIRWIDATYAGTWGRAVAGFQTRRRAGRWRGAPA